MSAGRPASNGPQTEVAAARQLATIHNSWLTIIATHSGWTDIILDQGMPHPEICRLAPLSVHFPPTSGLINLRDAA